MKTRLINFQMLWATVESRHVTRGGPTLWTIHKDTPDLGHAWTWLEYHPNYNCFTLHGEGELKVWNRGQTNHWRFSASSKGMGAKNFRGLPFGPLAKDGEVYLPGTVKDRSAITMACPKDGHRAWENRKVDGLPGYFEVAANSVSSLSRSYYSTTYVISIGPDGTTCELSNVNYRPYDGLLQHARPGNRTPRQAVDYLYKSCFGDAETFGKVYRQFVEVYGGMTTWAQTEGIDMHASVLAHAEDGNPPQNNVSIWLADKRCPGRTVIVKLLTRLGSLSGAAKDCEPSVNSWVEVVNDDGRIIDDGLINSEGMPQNLNNTTNDIGDKREGAKVYIASALAWMDEHAAMACLPLA